MHVIYSSFDNANLLPCINVKISGIETQALLDTGSSLTLIDEQFFSNIKKDITYKFLSRNVKIKTINSYVKFSGCIQISFKMDKFFFSHNFFITPIINNEFTIILGYDFIAKNAISIIPSFKSILYGDQHISLVNKNNMFNGCLHSQKHESNKLNNSVIENVPVTDANCISPHHVDACNIDAPDYSKKQNKVYAAHKIIIPENDIVYVNVKYDNEPNEYFLFIPTFQNDNVVIQKSLHALSTIQKNCFLIVIQNTSNESVHINKNSILGYFENVSEPDIQGYNFDEQQETYFCNLITPSPEIVQQRISDLKNEDFNLEHLSPEQKDKFLRLFSLKAQAFSKSLKTLGHTDLVSPQINLLNTMPIKTLPYPVPQALEQEALKQLNEMLEAGIITRSNSSWSCPVFLVKTP